MKSAAPAHPLTVMHLLPALDSGGVERYVMSLSAALSHGGHRAVIVSSGGRMVQELTTLGAEHHTLAVHRKSLFSVFRVRALRKLIEQVRPDVLHLHSRVPAWLAHYALRGMANPPPTVSTVHGLYSVNRYSRIMARARRVIAVSEACRQYILQNYPDTPPASIRLIHNGIDPIRFPRGFQVDDEWRAAFRKEFPQLVGKHLLTLPGRVSRLKGHAEFIDLIARLRTQHPDIHGLIVGEIPRSKKRYRAELEARIARLDLQGCITFTGARADVREIYAVSHIVYSLSTQPESFGFTIAEALALGVPVLGWAHGGAGEILHTMYPEGAIERNNRTALFSRSHQLLGQGARPPVAALPAAFTHHTMCRATIGVYHELYELSQQERAS
ncbi:MAG: glycosyltransferase [Rhodocyclaceae bacterium]|nr:glycosyltransferase [Rhodocyclaceae bacterium]